MVSTRSSLVTHGSHLYRSQHLEEQQEGGVTVENVAVQPHGAMSFITAQSNGHV